MRTGGWHSVWLGVVIALVVAPMPRPLVAQGPAPVGLTANRYSGNVHVVDSLPRTQWAKGMKIAGGIGFTLGALSGAALVHMGDGPVSTGTELAAALICGLMVGAVFAIVGGLIGSMFPE